ncbi:hypothetical protein [Microbacterium dextranolyticum]|uniref:Uncharacterized protein n=1 Tax=Microbacterium dextranolyticum TaxID=36806 RepID=A0A9W6HJZ8_9MICO|nr:hypothetical protein [Microbacterium dextranolyticum]MBM7461834.1 hypothetical protein [Microbacterium dextranolyticum]GLJ94075.1 hypothetical protein GCM10017591_01360 [Microbacterium dextranolyticum]
MADLVVNTDNLRNLASQLATVHGTLTAADGDAHALSGMIPHTRLASAVGEFASGWDRRRKDLADRVDQLQKRADGAADAFEGVDGQLADKLQNGSNG